MADYTYPALHRKLDPQEARALGVEQYADFMEKHGAELDDESADFLVGQRASLTGLTERHRRSIAHHEYYKYTELRQALSPEYGINLHRRLLTPNPYAQYRCGVAGMNAHTTFVVNDVVAPRAGQTEDEDREFFIGSYKDIEKSQDPQLLTLLHKALSHNGFGRVEEPIYWLNTLLGQDGLFVNIPDGIKLGRPLQIVNINDSQTPMMSNRQIFVLIGRDAEADIILCDHSMGETRYLTTQQVNVLQCAGSHLRLYGIEETTPQTTRFSNFQIRQEHDTHLEMSFITLSCGLSRNMVHVSQQGERATSDISGAVIADMEEHADNYVRIEHGDADCTSDMLFKYVMGGKSTGAFTGISYVKGGSRHIESQQQHQSLATSEKAHIYSRPVLEIYADDVKCSHGSTVGKLDETALFYMRQRGIPETEARLLLQHAFVNDVLRRIPLEPLRDRISSLVERRFRGGKGHCDGCAMSQHCQ